MARKRTFSHFFFEKKCVLVPKSLIWLYVTDSPANSGWRAGLPVGLWDLDYYRKHTYGGFAAGLGAPEYWNNAK